jgi:transcriptional regulator with XRE-family HTH domain
MSREVYNAMPTQRVKEAAEEKGWSGPMNLVREAGVGTTLAYQIWNNPAYIPSVRVLAEIARKLGVSVKDLLVDDPPTN